MNLAGYRNINSIHHDTFHCLVCCCIDTRTTINMTDKSLIVDKKTFNVCGCVTGSSKAHYNSDHIGSVRTVIGCWIDPTPYDLYSYISKKMNCAPTRVVINVDGIEHSIRVKQEDADSVSMWWVPKQHEMV